MKTYIITATLALLCFSCEQKSTTINPPGEKETTIIKEDAPTIIKEEAPSSKVEKKTETETKVSPGGTTTEKTETTEKR